MSRRKGPEPSLRAQWLGKLLRDLRNENGFTLDQAGEYLQRNGSMLSRYETGEYPIRRGDVLALIDLYGVSAPKMRQGLLELADDIWKKGWWEPYSADLGNSFVNHPWLESRASAISTYHTMFVPGLLQTAQYANAMIRNADRDNVDDDQLQRWVNLRLQRQQVLDRTNPPTLDVVIEEWVLRRPIGNRDIASQQLKHLLESSKRPAVTLRVMSADHGLHAGNSGTFEVFDMPEPYPEVAYIESLAGSIYIEQPEAEKFRSAYDDLRTNALSPKKSAALIANIAKETS